MYSIETKKLTKKFKDKIAVNEIDLNIKQGELFALSGTNGAGKYFTDYYSDAWRELLKRLRII